MFFSCVFSSVSKKEKIVNKEKEIVISSFNSTYPGKSPVKKFAISFFQKSLFGSSKAKNIWIDDLSALYDGYKDEIVKLVYFIKDGKFDAVIFLNTGNHFYFCNGKLLPENEIINEEKYNPYFYVYKKGKYKINKEKMDFPKPIQYDFLFNIYGMNDMEISNNLARAGILGFAVSLNNKNNAMKSLIEINDEILKLAFRSPTIKKWVDGIDRIETYSDRMLANEKRYSLHYFGIAVDIISREKKENYWFWSKDLRDDWWNVPKKQRAFVPQKVIDIFEDHGFVWGGKWYYFDNMHFEYRPELIKRKN
jgi:hypothetical protein